MLFESRKIKDQEASLEQSGPQGAHVDAQVTVQESADAGPGTQQVSMTIC